MESDVDRTMREFRADEEREKQKQRRGGEKGAVLAVAVGALVLVSVLGKVSAIPGGFVYGVIVLALYFLPAMIASNRGHRNSGPIFVVNLFLGWTLIGWVGCLAWGLAHQEEVRQ
jgi:hypothetical protein